MQLGRRSGMVPGRSNALTVSEKDVLVVLCAFCKLASRESSGSSDSTLNQGKLLALELLVKVGAAAGRSGRVTHCMRAGLGCGAEPHWLGSSSRAVGRHASCSRAAGRTVLQLAAS